MIVSSGIANYPAGSESASYVVPIPVGAAAGDILVVKIDTATSGVAITGFPSGVTTLIGQEANPYDTHRDCGLYAYTVPSSPPGSLTWTFSSAVRGNAVWVLLRGFEVSGAVANASSWASPIHNPATSVTAPALTSVADCWVLGGATTGSASRVVNPPSGWTMLQRGAQRLGYVATKGTDNDGNVGTATFDFPDNSGNTIRAWQAAFPPAAADPPLVATLMSEPFPGFTGDIADDAVVVSNPPSGDPVVIVNNKDVGGGLYVLNLDGEITHSLLGNAIGGIDYRSTIFGDYIIAADRENNRLTLLQWISGELVIENFFDLPYEPYGVALFHEDPPFGPLHAFVSDRGSSDFGTHYVYQYYDLLSGSLQPIRTISENGVMEGMSVDDISQRLFVAREDHGLYRYNAHPAASTTGTLVDAVGAGNLVADVEGVRVVETGQGKKILVSSQGDSSYHVYDLQTLVHEQRFTLVRPDGVTRVLDTDGLAAAAISLPGWPNGLIVIHDSGPNPSRYAFLDAGLVFEPIRPSGSFEQPLFFLPSFSGKSPRSGYFETEFSFTPSFEGKTPEIPPAQGSFETEFHFSTHAEGKIKTQGSFDTSFSFGPSFVGKSPEVPGSRGSFQTNFSFDVYFESRVVSSGEFNNSFSFDPSFDGESKNKGIFDTVFSFEPEVVGKSKSYGIFENAFDFDPSFVGRSSEIPENAGIFEIEFSFFTEFEGWTTSSGEFETEFGFIPGFEGRSPDSSVPQGIFSESFTFETQFIGVRDSAGQVDTSFHFEVSFESSRPETNTYLGSIPVRLYLGSLPVTLR